ncbi:hypothetical protein OOU_Y34scaffold00511g20 [Pyricularia oryzae Y34]|uniref:Uncharacterized protein n=1 Tax=Pyricularia oryzae (strain Y34) TaxID=1143189 RepID=A0AA97NZG6_PYRO3|nr:hypothetical protein OOU_Y34scaffold00511g20 [Pyricularia oryzae Y34]
MDTGTVSGQYHYMYVLSLLQSRARFGNSAPIHQHQAESITPNRLAVLTRLRVVFWFDLGGRQR